MEPGARCPSNDTKSPSERGDRTAKVAELRRLFSEAKREWRELGSALAEWRQHLQPDEFEAALGRLNLPDLDAARAAWSESSARAKADPCEDAASAPSPGADDRPASADRSPTDQVADGKAVASNRETALARRPKALAPSVVRASEPAPETRRSNELAGVERIDSATDAAVPAVPDDGAVDTAPPGETTGESAPPPLESTTEPARAGFFRRAARSFARKKSGSPGSNERRSTPLSESAGSHAGESASPPEGADLQDQIGELVTLLKEHLSRPAGSGDGVAIPQHVTLEIAREVAGRVRESVLSSLDSAGQGSGESASPASGNARAAGGGDERIPIDDLAAIIDRLTGHGPAGSDRP